ncbi:MAG: 30S ribosome-binding factor RbfA [bacterium]
MSVRLEKISSLIKDEISLIFLHKVQDPDFGLITVTGVKVSPDVRHAKIYVSIYQKEKREIALKKLDELNSWIRTELAHRIKLRHTPELAFHLDDSLDYVEKMEGLFKKIHENDNETTN